MPREQAEQRVEPLVLEYVPALHVPHCTSCCSDGVPTTTLPGPHTVETLHAEAPTASWKVPREQPRQVVWPLVFEYVPALHAR